jgi:hypothetical protein
MADRIEREIEEILKKIDNFVPERTRAPARRVGKPFAAALAWLGHRLARISLNQVMAWALLIVIIAFFIRVPGAGWVMIGALIVLATAFLLSRNRGAGGGRPAVEKRWRGEPIDLSGPSLPDRIKAWLKGRRRT